MRVRINADMSGAIGDDPLLINFPYMKRTEAKVALKAREVEQAAARLQAQKVR